MRRLPQRDLARNAQSAPRSIRTSGSRASLSIRVDKLGVVIAAIARLRRRRRALRDIPRQPHRSRRGTHDPGSAAGCGGHPVAARDHRRGRHHCAAQDAGSGCVLARRSAALAALAVLIGVAALHLTPPDNPYARVSPASGFWLLLFAFALLAADALTRLKLSPWARVGALAVVGRRDLAAACPRAAGTGCRSSRNMPTAPTVSGPRPARM